LAGLPFAGAYDTITMPPDFVKAHNKLDSGRLYAEAFGVGQGKKIEQQNTKDINI